MSMDEEDVDSSEGTLDHDDESSVASSQSDDGAPDDGGFLDVMAVEAQDEDTSGDDASSADELDEPSEKFHQFSQLPFELRRRIWELFCPELRLRPRVLCFNLTFGTARHRERDWPSSRKVWTVHDGIMLEDSTATTRTILSVHKESRAMALSVLKDSLTIDAGSGDAIVRFNQDTDIVSVAGLKGASPNDVFHLPGFAPNVKHLALEDIDAANPDLAAVIPKLLQAVLNLETLFVAIPSSDFREKSLAWCASSLVNRFHIQTFEKMPGLGEDMEYMYCWPSLRNHPDFANLRVPRTKCEDFSEPLASTLEARGLQPWPLVAFTKMQRYESVLLLDPDQDDDDSDDSSSAASSEESQTDIDEYESEGIDDADVLETFESSDEGDDLDLASDRLSGMDDAEAEANFSSFEARFSSPEGEPESDPEPTMVNRGRKRRIVVDSDEDADEADEPTTKRARVAQVVLSDSEGEEEPTQQKGRVKESEVVHSDSEGGDGASSSDSGDSADSEEGESEDEDEPPRQLSLAERLRLHRDAHPLSDGSEDDSDRAAGSQSDDDDGDGEDDGNGFIDAMADDGDEDEEDDDDDDAGY